MIYKEYQRLIPRNHRIRRSNEAERTKFDRFMETILSQGIEIANMLAVLPELYDVQTASGDALDTIGTLVGASRTLQHAIGNVSVLSDMEFRLLITTKIFANSWNGTNEHLEEILKTASANYRISHEDTQDMHMLFKVEGDNVDVGTAILANSLSVVKPAGVGMIINARKNSNNMLTGYAAVGLYSLGWVHFDAMEQPDISDESFLADESGDYLTDEFGVLMT